MKLREMTSTVRSKNAGVDHVTFDIFFTKPAYFEAAKRAPALQPDALAALFRVRPEELVSLAYVEEVMAIKFTLRRRRPSGDPGDNDIFGSQQYPPLYELEIEVPLVVESRRPDGEKPDPGEESGCPKTPMGKVQIPPGTSDPGEA